ncbi:hypothetical protein ACHAXT_000450 [Thalassiosira profunda]
MEVASPLTFARPSQGGKRRFGSPIDAPGAGSDDMDCSHALPSAKRRKRFSNEGGGGDSSFSFQAKENNKWSHSPFAQAPSRSPLGQAAGHAGPSAKRSRGSSPQPQHHDDGSSQKLQQLQQVVDQQAAEIHRLKSERDSLQASATNLSSQHAKVEQENKILKRAVAIQQERGNQANSELEGARQFKAQAEERIRRLEQMNLTLQYQLQAQSSSENDFIGFNPRPPDVY